MCESGSWVGSIMKPHSLQNTGYPVCFGLFSADVWCCYDWDDNRTEGKLSPILTFVLDEDISAVSTVYLKLLCLLYSHISYNFFLFSFWNLSGFWLHEHHLITPEITQTFWHVKTWISSGCKRLAVSCVHLQPRLNRAIVSESKYFDTAASRDTLTPDKREHRPTGVKMCPVLSEHPRSGQPGGPVQTDRSFTAGTACMHLWALQDWQALRDLSHTREE